jgi:hypothetical protein
MHWTGSVLPEPVVKTTYYRLTGKTPTMVVSFHINIPTTRIPNSSSRSLILSL